MPITQTEPPPVQQRLFDAMAGKIVHAAAELRVCDLLANGPRAAAALATALDADPGSLRRLLRALAGLGVLEQAGDDAFSLTPAGRPLLGDAPDSARELCVMLAGAENWRSWEHLVPAVRAGVTGWELAHGMPAFEYYGRHPGSAANFNAAMAEHSRDAAAGILAAADLGRFGAVTDVGGGDGTLLARALRDHPGLTGTVFDLPAGLASAAATLAEAGVADRCRLVPGDFFENLPGGADAYVLKQVLHDWDDERAAAILRNVRAAMPDGARVLVVDRMLPERVGPGDVPTLLVDVLMLVVTGGRERTEAEFGDLLARAGLKLDRVGERIAPFGYHVLEAVAA